ncbi:hypothetical protein H0H92_008823 [Tricholoma furcatifolium]|nr:hypothetical protein H0H92_008823 [Tricholoma furcatifolium]
MIHHAILGSLEHFITIIMEHFAGKWYICYNPGLPVPDKEYTSEVADTLNQLGLYADVDNVGQEELYNKSVNVRNRDGVGIKARAQTVVHGFRIKVCKMGTGVGKKSERGSWSIGLSTGYLKMLEASEHPNVHLMPDLVKLLAPLLTHIAATHAAFLLVHLPTGDRLIAVSHHPPILAHHLPRGTHLPRA